MDCVGGYFFHLRVDVLKEVESCVTLLHEGIQLLVSDFVTQLKLAIVRQILLHCVVGQMNGTRTKFQRIL